jgi:solute carrier family 25 phosphate transporter 23/24/25/41
MTTTQDYTQVVKQFTAGGVAGAITKTSIAPLERTKILFQLQGMSDAKTVKYKGILNTMRTVVTEEGIRGLYKGNGANVVRIVPTYALKFGFNDTFKAMFVKDTSAAPTKPQMMAAGTLAGLFQIMCTYPLDMVRTRLSLSDGLVAQGIHYKGIVDCARQTIKHEGPTALYKGIGPTFLSGAPYVGLQMTAYHVLKEELDLRLEQDGELTHAYTSFIAGAFAGLFAQTVTFPGDTVRRRMQTNGIGGSERIYSNTWDCCKKILAKDGVTGFYRGLGTNMVRCIPGAAIQFYAYDSMKRLLDVR